MASSERQILLAPGPVARAAALLASEPEQRWMLGQSREVRRSYADDVLGAADEETAAQAWMLAQDDDVRRSYVDEVLAPQDPYPHQEAWLLRQPPAVRASYVAEVLRRA